MELTPGSAIGITAECRCPPGTAQHHDSTTCYKLYEQGPCDIGQYFAPVNEPTSKAIMLVFYYNFFVGFKSMFNSDIYLIFFSN